MKGREIVAAAPANANRHFLRLKAKTPPTTHTIPRKKGAKNHKNAHMKSDSCHGHGISINPKARYTKVSIPSPSTISNVPATIGIHFLLKVHLYTSVVVLSPILNTQENTSTNGAEVNREMSDC